jgi:hypothetical protein
MKTLAKILLVSILFGGMQVCTTQPQSIEIKRQVFEKFDVKTNDLAVDAEKGKTLTFDNGTSIVIPENAFVDAKGNAIKGDVEVKYREFHDATDIIASGITMVYDSAGQKYNFETAGMFEIRANQNEHPVFVAQGKNIQVNLASHQDGSYNFYYLQEGSPTQTAMTSPLMTQAFAQDSRNPAQDGQWKLLSSSKLPKRNEKKDEKLKELEDELNEILPPQPIDPKEFKENDFAFDFDIMIDQFPELKAFEGIIWVYAGNKKEGKDDPSKNDWIFKEEWANIQLENYDKGAVQYKLTLSNAQKSFETIVSPALKGTALVNAKKYFKEKMKDYEKIRQEEADKIAKIETNKKFYQQQANFSRSFAIQRMGIFNCDIIMSRPNTLIVKASFTIDNQPIQEALVFLLEGRNVIQYATDGVKWNNTNSFAFSTDTQTRIIAVLPGDKVAILSTQDFKALNLSNIKSGANFTFHLQSVPEKIASVNDLHKLIERI